MSLTPNSIAKSIVYTTAVILLANLAACTSGTNREAKNAPKSAVYNPQMTGSSATAPQPPTTAEVAPASLQGATKADLKGA
jgi:hypothetical protein